MLMITENIIKTLSAFNTESVALLKQYHVEAGQRATGATEAAFSSDIVQNGNMISSKILGAAHIGALEYGRKPSSNGSTPGSLFDIIKKWIVGKGVFNYANDKELKGLAFIITRKIHKEGTYQFRNNGTTKNGFKNPVSKAFNEVRINKLREQLGFELISSTGSDVLEQFKTN